MLASPAARAQIAAGAALAGWHNRGGAGWWQHGNGGYGWVGPVFWPFAYYDIYDYAMWGSGFGAPFWRRCAETTALGLPASRSIKFSK
jgi:hypothetical protein